MPAPDPWDWSVDDVVKAICAEGCELQRLNPDLAPDLIALEETFRVNKLLGRFLLLDVDNNAMRDELAILQFGLRRLLLEFINNLRGQSQQYMQLLSTASKESATIEINNLRSYTTSEYTPKPDSTSDSPKPRALSFLSAKAIEHSSKHDSTDQSPKSRALSLHSTEAREYPAAAETRRASLKDTKESSQSDLSSNGEESRQSESAEDPPAAQDAFSPVQQQESAQVGIWDRLFEKYETLAQDNAEEPLPIYGESGSENGYDTETWEEMEAERDVKNLDQKESAQALPSKPKFLSPSEVSETIEMAKKAFEEQWRLEKKPKLQARVYRLWTQFHGQHLEALVLEDLGFELFRLEERLAKYETTLKDLTWPTREQLQKQCDVLHQTMTSICECRYKSDVLTHDSPPERPIVAARVRKNHERKAVTDSEEEDLTDEDLDDFIDDEGASPPAATTFSVGLPTKPSTSDTIKSPCSAPTLPLATEVIDLTGPDESEHAPAMVPTKAVELDDLLKQKEQLDLLPRPGAIEAQFGSQKPPDYLAMSVDELRKVSQVDISEADGYARVAWIISKQDIKEWPKLERLFNDSKMELSFCLKIVRKGLKSLKAGKYDKIRGLEDCDHRAVFIVSRCYFAWIYGFWRSQWSPTDEDVEQDGEAFFQQSKQSQAMKELLSRWPPPDFGMFYAFLLERLEWRISELRKRTHPVYASHMKHPLPGDDALDHGPKQKKSKTSARDLTKNADARQALLHKMLLAYADETKKTLKFEVAYVNTPSEHNHLIAIDSHISRLIQPHQLEGIRFLWKHLVDENGGCLLAHAMGTGKSLQVVAFLNTLAGTSSSTQNKIKNLIPKGLHDSTYLLIAPPSLVGNWHDEFLKWLPKDKGGIRRVRVIWPSLAIEERAYEIKEWAKRQGVLIISTNIFRDIVMADINGLKDGQPLSEVQHCLVQCPSVVIVDEAQELRNQNSKLYRAVSSIRTKFRVALTGSPLSNHLTEYFNLIEWASPQYLNPLSKELSAAKISAGLYADATHQTKRESLKQLSILTDFLKPKVHRIDSSILDSQLYGKSEYLIRVPLTEKQKISYSSILHCIPSRSKETNISQTQLWAYLFLLRMICCHPQCLNEYLSTRLGPSQGKQQLSKPQDVNTQINKSPLDNIFSSVKSLMDYADALGEDAEAMVTNPRQILDADAIEKQLELLRGQQSETEVLSNKMFVLGHILQFSKQCGEKVLVFSHSLMSLDFIQKMVETVGLQFIRIDGSGKTTTRHEDARIFNEEECDVALISTRAGGTGLNLFGASRVVIVDEWFNPMYEQQAIGRAYRIGQKKHVYVYRLVTAETYEEKMQNLSSFKSTLASRVLDRKQSIRQAIQDARNWLQPPAQPSIETIENAKDERVLDRILMEESFRGRICSVQIGNSFQAEEELTEEEKREAQALLASKLGWKPASLAAAEARGDMKASAVAGEGRPHASNTRVESKPRPSATRVELEPQAPGYLASIGRSQAIIQGKPTAATNGTDGIDESKSEDLEMREPAFDYSDCRPQ